MVSLYRLCGSFSLFSAPCRGLSDDRCPISFKDRHMTGRPKERNFGKNTKKYFN